MSELAGLSGWTDTLVVAALAYVAIALLSGLVHGYSGFGGNLLMVPLFSYLLLPARAIVLAMVIAAVRQVAMVRRAALRIGANAGHSFWAFLSVSRPAPLSR